jgi:cytochrome b involved in lipid metabolism
MVENLKKPKEWAKISRSFPGRTQHQIKNRFICLLTKTSGFGREKIRNLINNNVFFGLIYQALEKFRDEEINNCHEKNPLEDKKENNQNWEKFSEILKGEELNVEQFINFHYGGEKFYIDFASNM